jgi:hypothetical protein
MSTETFVANEVWDALTIMLATDYSDNLDNNAFGEALLAQTAYLAHVQD